MVCEYCSLLLCGHDANGKVGGVNSYVGLKSALHLEVEVLSLFAKILLADNYALDGYECTKSVKKCCRLRIGVVLEELSDIGRSESGDGAVGNSNGCLFYLVSLAVNFLDTGYAYLHTNLKTVFCNVVLVGVVYVVTVNAVHILNEELVTGVSCALGTCKGNDTLDGYGVAGSLLKVLSVGKKLVLGNLSLEGNGCAGAVSRIDGCGEVVNEVLGSLLVNVDSYVVLVNDNLNELGIGRPGYFVKYLLNVYLLNNGIVAGGFVRLYNHELIDIILCSLNVVLNEFVFGFFIIGELDAEPTANGLLNVVNDAHNRILDAAKLTGDIFNRACGKAGEHEYQNEN